MKNTRLRKEIRNKGIYIYEVANAMGISENSFYRMLNQELSSEEEKCIKEIIEKISSEDVKLYRKMHGTRLETIWYCMHTRCYNKTHRSYKNYGNRGIRICDEWLGKNGKINFYKWAMSNGYKENLTIDRIDVNGNYEPNNCRWLDYSEQNNNKRTSIRILHNGKELTPRELSMATGIKLSTIYMLHYREVKDFTDLTL